MHITYLGSADSWYLGDLRRAAQGRHVISPAPFSRLESTIDGQTVTVGSRDPSAPADKSLDLSQADCVLVRTMPPGSLEQVVFRMDALASLEAGGTLVVNPPKAIEAAVDKYLTTSRLARAGLPVPRTVTCQGRDAAMEAFAALGGDVVCKPIFGGEGRGITRLGDEALAHRAFQLIEQLGGVIYLQQFIEHQGFDVRVLVVGQTLLAVRRVNKLDWRTNLSRGAQAEPHQLTDREVELALAAAATVGAPLAGVDLLSGRDGQCYVVEVNAVPGWRGLAAATGVDVAQLVLDWIGQCQGPSRRSA